jgi:hypothetical protein
MSVARLFSWLGGRPEAYRPLFICGVAGSGTTLMVGLLDQHFENACCLHESALSMPEGAALRMQAVGAYGSLEAYRQAMYLDPGMSPEAARAECEALYRDRRRQKARSNVVLDKAPNVHLVRVAALATAFPDSAFLLIYRDPASNVEGLRRKWAEFRDAPLEEVCAFWEEVHRRFLDDTADIPERVRAVSYEALVREPEAVLEALGEAFELRRRERPLTYADRPDAPGKGLRNVVGGTIEISRRQRAPDESSLSEAEVARVRERLKAMYERLGAGAAFH